MQAELLESGALFKPCFCGPCFGAGDVPANGALSIRHTTRNFPNREGSRPSDGQLAGVILMDARSIAATARNHGVLTSAMDVDYRMPPHAVRTFDCAVYDRRVYDGWGRAEPEKPLQYGPNIAEWPKIPALGENLLMQVASVLRDPVTTTDELIPSGETSSYRSNPLKLASFALSRRDMDYVPRAKAAQRLEQARADGKELPELHGVLAAAADAIVNERLANGPYKTIFDFAERVDFSNVNRKAFETLALSGGFDSFGIPREAFFTADGKGNIFLDTLVKYGQLFQQEKREAATSLFGGENAVEIATPPIPKAESWSTIERLNRERELVGIYLSAHPLDDYSLILNSMCNTHCSELGDKQELAKKEEIVLGDGSAWTGKRKIYFCRRRISHSFKDRRDGGSTYCL